MKLLTINLNFVTQNTIKEFLSTKKFGKINQCDLAAGKSGTTFLEVMMNLILLLPEAG
jgi:lipid A disaccharide synthetase